MSKHITIFYCYNKITMKKYLFKDDTFFNSKFQLFLNKNHLDILYATSKIGLKKLIIAFNINKII